MRKVMVYKKGQKGLSLVELLVAVVVGLFLMGQVIQVVLNGKRTFQTEQELSQIQESSRFAIEFISRDVQASGYIGCSAEPKHVTNIVNSGSSDFLPNMEGFEYLAGATSFPSSIQGTILPNTDALEVRRAASDNILVITGHDTTAKRITLSNTHGNQEGDIWIAADARCNHLGLFQQSNTNTGTPVNYVEYNTGGTTAPGNCSASLKSTGHFDCANGGTPSTKSYIAGSKLLRFVSNTYYIRESASLGGVPALWREIVNGNDEELVQGVENLQVSYGVDTDNDGITDRYGRADQITTFTETGEPAERAAGPNGLVDWADVVSIRVSLLIRSLNPVLDTNTANAAFEGVAVPTDRFMRQRVVTTIQLRNRGLPL